MSYFDFYKALLASNGSNISESYVNTTSNNANANFENSPYYRKGKLNGVDIDFRLSRNISEKNELDNKIFLFRPRQVINIGDYIELDGDIWITIDSIRNEETYPKASGKLCNDKLRWVNVEGTYLEYGCHISKQGKFDLEKSSQDINISNGYLIVLVQYNDDTKNIQLSQRFAIGSQVYKTNGKDDICKVYNGNGCIEFTFELTSEKESDDMINKLADNSHLNNNMITPPKRWSER